MKSLNKFLLFVLILLAFNTCQESDPTNPFDSDTPKAIWTPTSFTAVQSDNAINLTWVQKETNISGFKIERKVGSGEWSNVASPNEKTTSWSDSNLTGGELHEYKLYATAGSNQSNTVTASETPILEALVNVLAATTSIESASATLNGSVNANGSATTVFFMYKNESSSDWTSVEATTKTISGNSLVNVSVEITELTPGETYNFKVKAVNSAGEIESSAKSFTMGCNKALVEILPASLIDETSVEFTGRVNAGGASTIVTFEYGETTDYGTTVTASPSPVTGSTNVNVSATISGLKSCTKYYYRVKAESCGGIVYSTGSSFETNGTKPQATVSSATDITENSAKIAGSVNAMGNLTTVTIDYGDTGFLGQIATTSPSSVSGNSLTNVNANLTSLKSCTKYYYRIKAVNCAGTISSTNGNFTTLGSKPNANTLMASSIASTSAKLNGQVNANGNFAEVNFEYGKTTNYGSTIEASPSSVPGNSLTNVSATLNGLEPNTIYYYRTKAVNCGGADYGAEEQFITTATFAISPNSRNVSYTSGSTSFSVTSSVDWSVEDDASWLTATKTSDSTISISYTANDLSNSRTANIRAFGTEGVEETVTVTQATNLEAYYPLTSNTIDAAKNYTNIRVENCPFTGGGIYSNGICINDNPNGNLILTPIITGLDKNNFEVSVDFKVTEVPSARDRPVFVIGRSYRDFGFLLNTDRTISLLLGNNQRYTSTQQFSLNTWQKAKIVYENGIARLYLDNKLIISQSFIVSMPDNDRVVTNTNFSDASVLKGYWKDLIIRNK